jgi:hypothetical protein
LIRPMAMIVQMIGPGGMPLFIGWDCSDPHRSGFERSGTQSKTAMTATVQTASREHHINPQHRC